MPYKISRLRRAAFFCLTCLMAPAFADTPSSPYVVRVLSWATPPANEDGSQLTDLAGYYIYEGASPDTLIPHYFSAPGKPWIVLTSLPGGVHYFGVTAVNVDGVESALTPVVSQ